ncbi:MAG: hypothetical protein PF448_12450 [Bacteroidales bacterium]|nr:hypothetical protein [Bacteroidales bacterium]
MKTEEVEKPMLEIPSEPQIIDDSGGINNGDMFGPYDTIDSKTNLYDKKDNLIKSGESKRYD